MSQSLSNVVSHVVFSTKGREPMITADLKDRLHAYTGGILRSLKCVPIEIGGMPDHIHILTRLHPTVALAKSLQVGKAKSSGWMSDQIGRPRSFGWQNGYGAFSVSEQNVEKVRRYIVNQEEHHKAMSYQDEYRAMCKKAKVPIDERYAWD
jgi:REP element-mobilizing transposase RayT